MIVIISCVFVFIVALIVHKVKSIDNRINEAIYKIYCDISNDKTTTFDNFVSISRSLSAILYLFPKSFFHNKLLESNIFKIHTDCIKINRIVLMNGDEDWQTDRFSSGKVSVCDWLVHGNVHVTYSTWSTSDKHCLFEIIHNKIEYSLLVDDVDPEIDAYLRFSKILRCDHEYPKLENNYSTYGTCTKCGYICDEAYKTYCDCCKKEVGNTYFIKEDKKFCGSCTSYSKVQIYNDNVIRVKHEM